MPDPKRFVVAGGGRVGRQTAEALVEKDYEVVVVEEDDARVEELADAYLGPVVHGDATDPAILEQAALEDADAIAALTDDAETNLRICGTAQRLAPSIRTLSRAGRETDDAELVDATVVPHHLGGDHAADLLAGEEVRTLVYPTADLDILEVEVAEDAPVAGRRLDEVRLPEGSLLISTADRALLAGADTVLEAGERYLLAVESDVTDELLNLLRG